MNLIITESPPFANNSQSFANNFRNDIRYRKNQQPTFTNSRRFLRIRKIDSHHSYRRFVDDMLQLLISYAHPESIPREVLQNHSMYPPRAHLFGLIAELISSAARSSNVRCRRLRRVRSLKLWTTILRLIPDAAGPSLEKTSQLWPVPMQRRFQSALQIQRQRRWPYAPFQGRTVGPRFQCSATPTELTIGDRS
jgi:hypothetical protein